MHDDHRDARDSLPSRTGLHDAVVAALLLSCGAFLLSPASAITGDTWFNLVFGRDVVANGLPHTNTHTLFMHGTHWVNAQWLAHATYYLLATHTNFATLFLVRVAIWMTTFAVVATWAVRSGSSAPRTAVLTILGSAIAAPHTHVAGRRTDLRCAHRLVQHGWLDPAWSRGHWTRRSL